MIQKIFRMKKKQFFQTKFGQIEPETKSKVFDYSISISVPGQHSLSRRYMHFTKLTPRLLVT